MKRTRPQWPALLTALILLVSALPAGAAPLPPGRECYMLSYQTGGYSHGERLASLYGSAMFSGVQFNKGYDVETSSLGKDALLNHIDAFKTTPDADDITYFSFVGTGFLKEGVAGIQLYGGDELSLANLSAALGALPGTVCVMFDVKVAGALPGSFNRQVAQAFSASQFQFLSACSATDAAFGAASIPRATKLFLTGCGMNVSTGSIKAKNWPADTNKNYAVSLKEAASYLKGQSKKLKAADFSVAYKAAGSGPNLFAYTGISSFRIFTKDPVNTRDTWTAINFTTTPENADMFSLLLSSSKPRVAAIDITNDGDAGVAIFAAGTTVLSAKSMMYPYPKATYTLKVLPISSESVTVRFNGQVVNDQTVNGTYGVDLEASAEVEPSDSTFQDLSWSSSNKKVALVEGDDYYSGRKCYIRVMGIGQTTITATTMDGVKASFTLNVPHVTVESLVPVKDTALPIGKKTYCGTATQPVGTLPGIAYKSGNPNVAAIDSKGYVTGKKLGTTVITATSVDNPAVKIQYTVTIKRDEYVWPAPDPKSLGDGMFFLPKRLSNAGRNLVCEVYFVNNTPSPVSKITAVRVGVKETENPSSTCSDFRSQLKFSKPVPTGGVGTYTFKFDRAENMSSSTLRIWDFVLPQGTLEPYATIRTP